MDLMFSIAELVRRLAALLLLALLASCGGADGDGEGGRVTHASPVARFLPAAPAFAGTGTWWNPAEPGTGLFVEAQGDAAAAALFAYADDGRPVWYSVVGKLGTNAAGKVELAGTLQKFHAGQGAPSSVRPAASATAIGPIHMVFDGDAAVVQVPGRRFHVTKANPGAPASGSRNAPETGILWNPAESGRGYTTEVIDGWTWLSAYHYDAAGEPTWNVVTGKPVDGKFTAELRRYEGGQTLAGPFRAARQVPTGTDVKVTFSSACEASLTFPGTAETPVQRPNFGGLLPGDECRTRAVFPASDARLASAILQLVLFFALVTIPGLSRSRAVHPEQDALFVQRLLIGSGLLAWAGLILTYLVPALRPVGCFALLAWLIAVWHRVGLAGIVEQLKPARELLAVQLLACLFVLSLGYLYGGFTNPFQAAAQRWFHWTPDSSMPSHTLQRLLAQDLTPLWDWQVSDRPPLQSAFLNLLSPFGDTEFDHLLAGVVCQSLVIAGVYLLLRALRVGPRLALAALALFATSGFFLMNGFFTWPKLLSAGYLAAAAAMVFSRDDGDRRRVLLAGALAGLGCLAHGGGAFALLAILLVAACGSARRRIPWFTLAFLLTALPWILFTKVVDPPGDRLAKWHLAGIVHPDGRSALDTIVDSYRSRTLQQVAGDKLQNASMQFGGTGGYRDALRTGSKVWWDHQFNTLAFACFPAWLGVAAALLFPRSRSALAAAWPLHLLWMVALAITCVMMFGPVLDADPNASNAYPSLPQQSYFVPALALAGAALAVSSLPPALRAILIALHLWGSTLPYFFPPVEVPGFLFTNRPYVAMLLVALASLAGLAWFFLRPLRQAQRSDRL